MEYAGRFRGLSPWRPGEYGTYVVESLRPRKTPYQQSEVVVPSPE